MKLGIGLTMQFERGQSLEQQVRERIEQVELARDGGFDLVACSQHYLSDPYAELQAVPVLGRLSAHSGTMRLLTGVVLLPLHNPVEIAEQGATLDVLSGGRFVLGVGIGYRDVEFDAFGVARGEALARFSHGVRLIRRLWTEERVTYDGPFWRLDDVPVHLRPVQRPHPPIWVAANADAAVRRAARIADAWYVNPHARLDTLRAQLELYRQALAEAGKPFPAELPMGRELYVAASRDAAWRECGPYLAGKYRSYTSWGQDKVVPEAAGFRLELAELAEGRFVVGDPDDCVEGLRRCAELGATTVIVRLQWPGMPGSYARRAIELLAERVIPRITAL
ncbi:MAG TPA: LLM class flavin-dependent oxidoreductase [Chloroflexota bacterium]|nr:LLM class flavin-dependent oxidoreductase [Chloroflexota bacterium]